MIVSDKYAHFNVNFQKLSKSCVNFLKIQQIISLFVFKIFGVSAFLVGAYGFLTLDHHELAALGAGLLCGSVPAHELTIGIAEASVIFPSFSGDLDYDLVTA